MIKYLIAILTGLITGGFFAILINTSTTLVENYMLLFFWPVGLIIGHHSAMMMTLLAIAVIQFAVVLFCRKRVTPFGVPLSVFVLIATAGYVASIGIITLGSQI